MKIFDGIVHKALRWAQWLFFAGVQLLPMQTAAQDQSNAFVYSPDKSKVPAFSSPGAYCAYVRTTNSNPLDSYQGVQGASTFFAYGTPIRVLSRVDTQCNDSDVSLEHVLINGSYWYILPRNITNQRPPL
ncbi:MAG: hypothetical protein WA431_11890 [Candidatus Cybelea sp.]